MQQRGCRRGAEFGVEHTRQRLIFHFDQLDRLLGDLFRHRRHPRHRVAHVARPVAAEDVPVLQIQPGIAGEILAGDDCFDARQAAGFRYIDALDQGVRVRAALDAGEQQSGTELDIVGE